MTETWGSGSIRGLSIDVSMFDKDCTGNFKVIWKTLDMLKAGTLVSTNLHNPKGDFGAFVLHQEVKRKKYLFFTKTEYLPIRGLTTRSEESAKIILENIKKLYLPIKRDKVLSNILNKLNTK